MEICITNWHDMRIINDIYKYKLVFIESRDSNETFIALNNYKYMILRKSDLGRRACDIGRGGLLMCVARGRIAEGVDFSGHYGRCGVMIGLPFQYEIG